LNGARGVLVNITASSSLKMKETRAIMDHISGFASPEATVIFGTAYDDSMGDNLRVTVVATGLGRASRPVLVSEPMELQRTGTDNMPIGNSQDMGVPSVLRNPRTQATAQVRALETAGMEHYDIPAFLRRQAD
jgi:cell division protein FtsZ